MKSVIAGTAGHIDHGKTALVRALTGIDADRLEEEKRRGITIDIGFAHMELAADNGEQIRIGFVDVPGHERFVRNMLAGVGGIDMVLLVIAADEGIKPQTREHFDICKLLSIPDGIAVLTKADLVDSETLGVVRLEVEEFLKGSFLEAAPIVPVSALTGQGLNELKNAMLEIVKRVPAKNSSSPVRLPVDRVFSMKGFGTVVTGTLIGGTIEKEQELQLLPGEEIFRVRGVQVHGEPAQKAIAGQRTALNLAGPGTDHLARGAVLTRPSWFHSTQHLDVRITLLPSAKALKNRARIHFHAQTAETVATVRLLSSQTALAPGSHAFARLTLDAPVFLVPGDRFIVRQFSPVITIGGGIVIDALPARKLKGERLIASLEKLMNGTPDDILMERAGRRDWSGLTLAEAVSETGWRPSQIEDIAKGLITARKLVRVGNTYVSVGAFQDASEKLLSATNSFHDSNPLVGGINKEQLRENIGLHEEMFAGVLNSLVRTNKLEVSGELVRVHGRGVEMKDEEAEAKKTIETAFASAGLKAPALKDVLASLKVDRIRAQKIVTLLLRDRVLVKVSDELVFHQSAIEALKHQIKSLKSTSPAIDVAKFKELTGVSRKYAIPLLEYLDRERVTRRVGDNRVIL